MEVVVEDKQLSLAIGKKGQNVRLAAKLTGWRIDIKSEEEKRKEVEAQFGALELGGDADGGATIEAEAGEPSDAVATDEAESLADLSAEETERANAEAGVAGTEDK
jgi:N utilization substance protein A